MTELDLKLENIRKKQSMKNKVAVYAMVLMCNSILGQIFLGIIKSDVRLPLEIICGGCFTLLGLYFGANILQKNIMKDNIEGK